MKAIETRIHNVWSDTVKGKTFRNKIVRESIKFLNAWKNLTLAYFQSDINFSNIKTTDSGYEKYRVAPTQMYNFIEDCNGNYILLTDALVMLFKKFRMKFKYGILRRMPIFTEFKSLPVFWINGEIITLWNFFFEEPRFVKKVTLLSDQILVFDKVEYSYLNFIETKKSKPKFEEPVKTISDKHVPLILEKYIRKNIWLLPTTDIRYPNVFPLILFTGREIIPCFPYRLVFRVLKILPEKKISITTLHRIRLPCKRFLVSYLTPNQGLKKEVIYMSSNLEETLEKGKIYNGLITSFLDLHSEWIFPILIASYEEDLREYEVLQEIFLMHIRNLYIRSENIFSIQVDYETFVRKVISLWKFLVIKKWMNTRPETTFSKLKLPLILELVFTALSPEIMLTRDKKTLYYIPLLIALLNLKKEKTIKLAKQAEEAYSFYQRENNLNKRNQRFFQDMEFISSIIDSSYPPAHKLLRTILDIVIPFLRYKKTLLRFEEKGFLGMKGEVNG